MTRWDVVEAVGMLAVSVGGWMLRPWIGMVVLGISLVIAANGHARKTQ